MQDFLNQIYFGNAVLDYIIFALVVVVSMVIVTIFKRFLLKYLKKWQGTETKMNDHLVRAVKHYLMPIIYYSIVLLDLQMLTLSTDVATATNVTGMVLAAIFANVCFCSGHVFF